MGTPAVAILYIRHVHVLGHGHFTDIVSVLTIYITVSPVISTGTCFIKKYMPHPRMYKMATAGVPMASGTILAVHLQKCSHLSNLFCIEFQYNRTMPALAVNIIIVHPWDVVFNTRGVVFPRENNIPKVNNYDVHRKCRH
jgi:hypothetical protein